MEPEQWAAVGAFAAVVGLFQFYFLHRQNKRDQITLWRDLAREWRDLRESWGLSLLLARGPDDYYVDAPNEARHQLRRARASIDDGISGAAAAARSGTVEEWGEALLAAQIELRRFELAAREVIRFFDGIALLILDGILKPRTAYTVIGIDVVRNSAVIRTLVEGRPPQPGWAGKISEDRGTRADTIQTASTGSIAAWAQGRPGLVRRVLVLLDILWAEAVARGDVTDFDLLMAAKVKARFGTGRRNRRRAARAALRARSPIMAVRLRRLLRRSEYRSLWNPFGVSERDRHAALDDIEES